MNKITVDVVVLPDQAMSNEAISVSEKQVQRTGNDKILLNSKNCLPHISLAMGALEKSQLPEVDAILKSISKQYATFNLEADLYQGLMIPSGEIVSEFNVKKTPELQSIHEEVMRKLSPYLTNLDLSTDMVFSPPAVEEITLFWIQNYPTKSSFERFRPHITTGFGKLDQVDAPATFTAPTLALAHLGNYCTCRNILCRHQLKTA